MTMDVQNCDRIVSFSTFFAMRDVHAVSSVIILKVFDKCNCNATLLLFCLLAIDVRNPTDQMTFNLW
jgi:hypothetical protein